MWFDQTNKVQKCNQHQYWTKNNYVLLKIPPKAELSFKNWIKKYRNDAYFVTNTSSNLLITWLCYISENVTHYSFVTCKKYWVTTQHNRQREHSNSYSMTCTYQHTSHETDFKYCWNNVECKGTQHKVDASTMHKWMLLMTSTWGRNNSTCTAEIWVRVWVKDDSMHRYKHQQREMRRHWSRSRLSDNFK